MILSIDRGFAFIHVPHTGGTSIEAAYASHALSGDLVYGDTHESKHTTARQLKAKLGNELDGLMVIAITRNPWDRIHSHYYHAIRDFKIGLANDPKIPQAYALSLRMISQYRTFAEFVRGHWLTKPLDSWQHYCCDRDGKRLVNYVIRFERLAECWPTIAATMGLRNVDLPHINHCDDRPDYRAEYDERLQCDVREFCKVEIELYGHRFDL